MIYVLMGLVSATLFGISAVTVYGTEGLLANAWVDYVFWWLIAASVGLASLESTMGLRCSICRRLPVLTVLCAEASYR
jgi:hypothetical protein